MAQGLQPPGRVVGHLDLTHLGVLHLGLEAGLRRTGRLAETAAVMMQRVSLFRVISRLTGQQLDAKGWQAGVRHRMAMAKMYGVRRVPPRGRGCSRT